MAKCAYPVLRLMLALILASRVGVAFASQAAPLQSNYVFEVKSSQGRVAYVYGSAHYAASLAPVHLGQCVKKLLKASTAVFLESDQLAFRGFLAKGARTVHMARVVEFIDKPTLDALRIGLFGPGSDGESKLRDMDAQTLVSVLTARIPGREEIAGMPDHGLDTEIAMVARFLNLPVAFVETPQEQWRFFGLVSPQDYAKAIVAVFRLVNDRKAGEDYHHGLLKLMQAMAVGDEKALMEHLQEEGFVGYYRGTILARNPSLAASVDALASAAPVSPVFFALGATHLAGDEGVVRRLGRQGYQVTRLCE